MVLFGIYSLVSEMGRVEGQGLAQKELVEWRTLLTLLWDNGITKYLAGLLAR